MSACAAAFHNHYLVRSAPSHFDPVAVIVFQTVTWYGGNEVEDGQISPVFYRFHINQITVCRYKRLKAHEAFEKIALHMIDAAKFRSVIAEIKCGFTISRDFR